VVVRKSSEKLSTNLASGTDHYTTHHGPLAFGQFAAEHEPSVIVISLNNLSNKYSASPELWIIRNEKPSLAPCSNSSLQMSGVTYCGKDTSIKEISAEQVV